MCHIKEAKFVEVGKSKTGFYFKSKTAFLGSKMQLKNILNCPLYCILELEESFFRWDAAKVQVGLKLILKVAFSHLIVNRIMHSVEIDLKAGC